MNELILNSKIISNTFNISITSSSFKRKFEKETFGFRILALFHFYNSVIKNLIKRKYDLAYIQVSPTGLAFLRDAFVVTALKFRGIKIIVHLHGLGIKAEIEKSKVLKLFYQFIFKDIFVIILSHKVFYDIASIVNTPPYVVPNCLPVNNIAKKTYDSDCIKILFFSNLFYFKGILDLLEALSLLKDKNLLFECNIVGNEGDITATKLNYLLKKNNLEGLVNYNGPLYGSAKDDVFTSSDIFVFPSHIDIWGLVVLEAMQAGLPVVAYNTGAISDMVIDNVSGFLCQIGHIECLAEKISQLIEEPELRKNMGLNGRQIFLQNFTFDKLEKNLISVFNDILVRN